MEKKKKEYPKTYEECSIINGAENRISLSIIGKFTKLINARNAYWKLYGDEMGLGKPWEPDDDIEIYNIYRVKNAMYLGGVSWSGNSNILEFPTQNMRDAFYENFKSEIESVKELL